MFLVSRRTKPRLMSSIWFNLYISLFGNFPVLWKLSFLALLMERFKLILALLVYEGCSDFSLSNLKKWLFCTFSFSLCGVYAKGRFFRLNSADFFRCNSIS